MAMNHAAKHVMRLRNLFHEMGIFRFVREPTVLEGDNKQMGPRGYDNQWHEGGLAGVIIYESMVQCTGAGPNHAQRKACV
jgi:hypothetical protein